MRRLALTVRQPARIECHASAGFHRIRRQWSVLLCRVARFWRRFAYRETVFPFHFQCGPSKDVSDGDRVLPDVQETPSIESSANSSDAKTETYPIQPLLR